MKKKILAIIAVIALVVTMLPTMVFAEEKWTSFEFTSTALTRDNIKSLIEAEDFGINPAGYVFYLSFFSEEELQYYYALGEWFDADTNQMDAPDNFNDIDKVTEIITFITEKEFDPACTVTANGTTLQYEDIESSELKNQTKQCFTLEESKKIMTASLVYDLGPLTSFEFSSTPLTRDNIKSLIAADDFGISSKGNLLYLCFFSEGKLQFYYTLTEWFDAAGKGIEAPENFNDIDKVTEVIIFRNKVKFDTAKCTVTANGAPLYYEDISLQELKNQTKHCFTFGADTIMVASLVYDLGNVTKIDFTYEKLTRDNIKSLIAADDFGISYGGEPFYLSFFKNGELKYYYCLGYWLDANVNVIEAPDNFNDVDQVLEVVAFRIGAGIDTEKITVTANGTPLKYEKFEDGAALKSRLKQYFTYSVNTVMFTSLIHDLDPANPKTADENHALPYGCAALAALALLGLGFRKLRREK